MTLFFDPNAWLTLAQDTQPPAFPGQGEALGPAPSGEGAAGTEADGTNQGGTQTPPPGGSGFGGTFMMIMLGLLVFMIVSSILAGRKQKRMRAELLSSLSKHDKVITNAGMYGTIVEIKEDEIVLRIDDETGTRARFAREAVATKRSAGSSD